MQTPSSDVFSKREGLHEAVSRTVWLAGLQRGVSVKDVGAGGVCICLQGCRVACWRSTAAWRQIARRRTSSSSSSSETEAMQNVSKDVHICCLERESGFSQARVCVLLPCRVASGICKVSLTSAVMPTPLSAHKRQNSTHRVSALSCCAYLIYLFFSVCLLRLLLRLRISSLNVNRRTCFIIGTPLKTPCVSAKTIPGEIFWPLLSTESGSGSLCLLCCDQLSLC